MRRVLVASVCCAVMVGAAGAAESNRPCDQYGEPATASGIIANMRGAEDARSKVWGFDIGRSGSIDTSCRIVGIAADKPVPGNCRNGARFRAQGIAIGTRLSATRVTCE